MRDDPSQKVTGVSALEIPDEEPGTRGRRVERTLEVRRRGATETVTCEAPALGSPELRQVYEELAHLRPEPSREEVVRSVVKVRRGDGGGNALRAAECCAPIARFVPGPQRFSEREVARLRALMDASEERRRNQAALVERRREAFAAKRLRSAGTAGVASGAAGREGDLEVGQPDIAAPPASPGDFVPKQWNTAMGPSAVGYYVCQVKEGARGRVLYYSNGFDLDGPAEGWRWEQVTRVIIMIPGTPGVETLEEQYLQAYIASFGSLDAQFEGLSNAHEYAIFAVALPEAAPHIEDDPQALLTPPFSGPYWPDAIPGPLRGTYDEFRPSVVTWKTGQHGSGYDAPNSAVAGNISIFDVIDCLIDRAIERFVGPLQVYVIGHSAGGQAAHRYALADSKTALREELGVFTRYISMNPGYYSFLNPGRLISPEVVAIGIYNESKDENDSEIIVSPDQMLIANYQWQQDPLDPDLLADIQALVDDLGVDADVATLCADYDLKGGARGFSADDSTELMRSFADAAQKIAALNLILYPDPGDFPAMLRLFAANYFTKDIWHLQSRTDEDSKATSGPGAMQGPTRCHRWWGLREGILRWNLGFTVRAARRFYGPHTTREHSGSQMFATEVAHVALDILPEEQSNIAQYHDAMPVFFTVPNGP